MQASNRLQIFQTTADTLDCTVPESFKPLIDLLNTIVELALIAGILLGTLGFLIAALYIIVPGQDNSRKGKLIGKNTFLGTVLLLSAQLIIDFLVIHMEDILCV